MVGDGVGASKVKDAFRFAAGVPESVFRTWQVMGEDILRTAEDVEI